MTQFDTILHDLKNLQARLKRTGDCVWQIKSALQQAHHDGHKSGDFLPRRLNRLQSEAQLQMDGLLAELRQMAAQSLHPHLFVFASSGEVKTFLKIKQVLRYLQNAYMDHSLRESLNHWNKIIL